MPTRQSEVLSRGAGMRALAGNGQTEGLESSPGKTNSVGMGTFGKEPRTSQEALDQMPVSHAD